MSAEAFEADPSFPPVEVPTPVRSIEQTGGTVINLADYRRPETIDVDRPKAIVNPEPWSTRPLANLTAKEIRACLAQTYYRGKDSPLSS